MSDNNLPGDVPSGGQSTSAKHRDAARGGSRISRPLALGAMAFGALSIVPVLGTIPAANATCAAYGGFTIGSGCTADGYGTDNWAIAIGEGATATSVGGTSNHALAIGNKAAADSNLQHTDAATANTLVAIGDNSSAVGSRSSSLIGIAIGTGATVVNDLGSGQHSLALGNYASANSGASTDGRALAIGTGSAAAVFASNQSTAVAIGNLFSNDKTQGAYARANLGQDTPDQKASNYAIALGQGTLAEAGAGVENIAVAVGPHNHSYANFGNRNQAFVFGQNSTAVAGIQSPLDPAAYDALIPANKGKFGGNTATVIGNNSFASASKTINSIAKVFGNHSTATVTHDGSTATAAGDNKDATG